MEGGDIITNLRENYLSDSIIQKDYEGHPDLYYVLR